MNVSEHHAGAIIGAVTSWVGVAASVIAAAMPFLQVLSIALAITASIYAIRVSRRKLVYDNVREAKEIDDKMRGDQ